MTSERLALTSLAAIVIVGMPFLLRSKTASANHGQNGSERHTAVLVELFTSEGCSDCPPADQLLEKLDCSQPIDGTEVIALSEHVDYWNNIGWRDPYSSGQYSERQGAYAHQFGLSSVYTPQMVVDGKTQFVGSDEREAIQAIESASRSAKIPVSLSSLRSEANKLVFEVDAGPFPPSMQKSSAHVLLAIADETDQSSVTRGENAGRNLKHVAVLRSLTSVGELDTAGRFSREVTFNFNRERTQRVVAIVQESGTGKVLGVELARLLN